MPKRKSLIERFKIWSGENFEEVCEDLFQAYEIQLKENETLKCQALSFEQVPYSEKMKISDMENIWIRKALIFHKNNKSQAARSLGITIKTLYNKIREYGIDGHIKPYSPRKKL